MRIVVFAIAIIFIIGMGSLWLHASQAPHQVPAPVAPLLSTTTAVLPAIRPPVAPMFATHTVGSAIAMPSMITVGTSTQVTLSIQITDPAVIATSVNLLRLGAPGVQPTILGVMQNAGNGVYTIQPVFNESVAGQIQLQVSAAFQGSLQRVLSNIVAVSVWGILNEPTAGFVAQYPPSVSLVNEDTSSNIYYLDSSPNGVAIGGTPDSPGSPLAVSGYRIIFSVIPFNTSVPFDINQYLLTQYPYSQVGSVASTSIGGVPGYIVMFTQEENGGHPNAIVYHNGYVFQIVYVSTDGIPGFSDQAGLNNFAKVLQTFTFTQ